MATIEPTTIIKNTWTKVLTNVTTTGKVFVIDQEVEPTKYLVTKVPTGDPVPSSDYDGGIVFKKGLAPQSSELIDVYIKAVDYDGKVVIFT